MKRRKRNRLWKRKCRSFKLAGERKFDDGDHFIVHHIDRAMHSLAVACHLRLLPLSLSLSLLFFNGAFGKRPELVSSSIWYTNQTVSNMAFELGVVKMVFDEPLYVTGSTFLCSSAYEECPQPLPCTACDWSSQNVKFSFVFSTGFKWCFFFEAEWVWWRRLLWPVAERDGRRWLVRDQSLSSVWYSHRGEALKVPIFKPSGDFQNDRPSLLESTP